MPPTLGAITGFLLLRSPYGLRAGPGCSSSCSEAFVTGCVGLKCRRGYTGAAAYSSCKAEVGAPGHLARSGCEAGCRDTAAMLAAQRRCPGNGTGAGQEPRFRVPRGVPSRVPTVPTLCTPANRGRCQCANLLVPASAWEGLRTYTWWILGEQRCATVYRPLAARGPLPVLLDMECYAKDQLAGMGLQAGAASSSALAAKRFGLARVFLSTPDGAWHFNEQRNNPGFVINDSTPMRCGKSDSKDLPYLEDVLDLVAASPERYDALRVYAYGASQNGMFAGLAGSCFRRRVAGMWQGAAGMAVNGWPPVPPGHEGTCRQCRYWPVYPCHSSYERPLVGCLQAYTNDPVTVVGTGGHARYMYDRMSAEGHDARLMLFEPAGDARGGHAPPRNEMDWVVGCLGCVPACSPACAAALDACVAALAGGAASSPTAYAECLTNTLVRTRLCEAGCAPTRAMLERSEAPHISLSEGAFGLPVAEGPVQQPSTSICSRVAGGGVHTVSDQPARNAGQF